MRTVLVAGFTQTVESWDGVRDGLRAHNIEPHPVAVPDAPTFEATANALAVNGGNGIWCGYSMGGRLCLSVALAHPEIVTHLVLVSATPGIIEARERAARIESDERLALDALRRGTAAFVTDWLAQPMFADVPSDAPGTRERFNVAPQRLAHDLRVLGTGSMPNYWDRLRELTMPITLVTGRHDTKFSAIARAMHECIPHATHIEVDCGHAVPQVLPESIVRVLHDIHKPTASSVDETI